MNMRNYLVFALLLTLLLVPALCSCGSNESVMDLTTSPVRSLGTVTLSTPVKPTPSMTPLATATSIATRTPYNRVPEATGDGWQTASLAEAGIDPVYIGRMLAAIYHGPDSGDSLKMPSGNAKMENIHSILIVRDGKLVFEEYFYQYDRNYTHDTASATKSILSLLVGLAIDQGFLSGVDELVLPWFPDYAPVPQDTRMEQMTIEDLLTMRHGLDCDDWLPGSRTYWRKDFEYKTKDVIASVFSLPMETTPGSHFSYCSPAVDLLGGLLSRATRTSVTQFANQTLFHPLGITARGFLMLPGGWPNASGNVYLTGREMAKIGQMVLQEGRWEGEQVVPEEWIRVSTREQLPLVFNTTWGKGYGYLWWLSDVPVGGSLVHSVCASGAGGQVITIFPDLQMVVVITGGNYENDEGQPFQIMERYILPAVLK